MITFTIKIDESKLSTKKLEELLGSIEAQITEDEDGHAWPGVTFTIDAPDAAPRTLKPARFVLDDDSDINDLDEEFIFDGFIDEQGRKILEPDEFERALRYAIDCGERASFIRWDDEFAIRDESGHESVSRIDPEYIDGKPYITRYLELQEYTATATEESDRD